MRRVGTISAALGALTANLLAVTAGQAQDAAGASAPAVQVSTADTDTDDTLTDVGLTRMDAAVLFYQEAGGRVHATEPVISATLNSTSGDVLSFKFTADSLTGATPNGAAPADRAQTFLTPAQAPGTTTTATTASGGTTLVTIPGTGTVARQYVTAANALPVDPGFRDQRYAGDLGYAWQYDSTTKLSFGAGISSERDYRSYTLSTGVSKDLNERRTTLSAGLSLELDRSEPLFGTPQPLTVMSADPKGPARNKTVTSVVVGVTQAVNRYWLAQLNYSFGYLSGYQTDPYRVLSVVDATSGEPLQYLYENRPGTRLRQSLYFGNKIALGPTYASVAVRGYHDSWGITSVTAEISDRIPIGSHLYVEPEARYYSQSAANFFHDYLIGGAPLPAYASSDSRLDKFHATTAGLKVGYKVTQTGEFYLQFEDYRQAGRSHVAGAPGQLQNQNLFSGVRADSVIVGYTFAFW